MSDPLRKPGRMTIDEFVEWDDGSGIDYELLYGEPVPRHIRFLDGRPVAQASPSAQHAAIVTNIAGELRNRLRPPCRGFIEIGIRPLDRDDTFFKADLAVSCMAGFIPGWMLPDPVLVVEVLSPGTAGRDESEKLTEYCKLPSVQAVLLVQTKSPGARLVRRVGDHWELEFLNGMDAVVRLPFLGVDLPLAEVYRDLAFGA